jgi:GntR family transcriptional regulator, rspAB operon transcriptional repressor
MDEIMSDSDPRMTPLLTRSLHMILDCIRKLKPGDRLAGEEELASECDASRTTVRGVLQQMLAGGLIERCGSRWKLRRVVRASDYPGETPVEVAKVGEAVRYLLEQVGSGHIRPGRRFSERTISKALGCSVSPVREALLSLAPLGLFRKDDRRQWEAVELDKRQVEELMEFRSLVEGYGLERLMRPPTLALYRARLEDLLKRTRRLGNSKHLDMEGFSALDIDFHRLLLEAPGNAIMRERTAFMHALVEFQLRNDKFTPERARLGLRQHVGIMEAILAGDRRTASRLLNDHFCTAVETLVSFREEKA